MKTPNKILILFAIIAICTFACKNLDKPEPTIPVSNPIADFTITNTDFTAPVDVTVVNTSKNISSNSIYQWDFANGQTPTDKNPTVGKYLIMGNYKIKLTVTDGGISNTKEISISVTDPKQPVKACFAFTASNGAAAPSLVSFDASCAKNGKIYTWDFGDAASANNTAVGINTTHLYQKVGNYKAKLSVVNGTETKDTTININILNPPPKACLTYSADNNGVIPSKVSFDASCSINANAYNWNFGDINSGAQNTGTGSKPTHTYNTNGDFNVKLTATGLGGSVDTSFIVKIKGPTVVSSFTIANGNCVAPCTATFTNTSQNATTYAWDFGDGATSSSNALTVTHLYAASGTFAVKLTATGSGGTISSTQNTTIKTGNDKKVIDLSSVSITPFHGVQRSDGKYHILYATESSNGSVYSVIVDKEFTTSNNLQIKTGLFPEGTVAQSDGSIYISSNTSDNKYGKLLKVSSLQSLSFEKTVDFNNGTANTLSSFVKPANFANDDIVVGGYYINSALASNVGPAIASFNKSGTPLLNKITASTTENGLAISQLAQTSSGSMIGVGSAICFFCNENNDYILFFTSGGVFFSKIDLGTKINFTGIIRITGTNNFFLYNENGKNIRGVSSTGTMIWDKNANATIIKKAISISDGSIILCGNSGNAAYLAKYTPSGTLLWEKTFFEKAANSVSYASSVEQTSDGGYLLTGGYYITGVNETDLYLVKTDKDGNIQ